MKKVKRRAWSALVIAFALLVGLGVYVYRFATESERWVRFSANGHLYESGSLLAGTVTDRSGVVLADVADGRRVYADDAATRIACLHAVGDAAGNIGSGALTAFADRLSGYNPVTGVTTGGGTVRLSIDAELQRTACAALGAQDGAVMVCNYETGEVLCMVSAPSYDPAVGFDGADPRFESVYVNRCLGALYTPGSVFKLVTLAAALEKIDDLASRTFVCTGSTETDGSVIRCTGVHGAQTIEQALANSCNCAFAEISQELGGDVLAAYAEKLGFTQRHRVSGIATAAGRFDAAAVGTTDLAWSGIGQSTDLVCPAAMLRYTAAIAAGGTGRELTLLAGEKGARTRLLSADTAARIREMMSYNVAAAYGTWNFPGLALCAKSGTAETGDGSSHAWFTGFLDDPAHPYAFVVVAENAGSGLGHAGPVANAVLQRAVALADGTTS